MIRARELLLHPIALAAIALLVVNDHWLKYAHPSVVTGKLSDIAGLTFFPLLVLVALEAVAPRRATIHLAAAMTAVVFALVKCVPAATDVYRHALGFLQSPLAPSPVDAVTDPTDLVALPCVLIAVAIRSRRLGPPHGHRGVAGRRRQLDVRAVRAGDLIDDIESESAHVRRPLAPS